MALLPGWLSPPLMSACCLPLLPALYPTLTPAGWCSPALGCRDVRLLWQYLRPSAPRHSQAWYAGLWACCYVCPHARYMCRGSDPHGWGADAGRLEPAGLPRGRVVPSADMVVCRHGSLMDVNANHSRDSKGCLWKWSLLIVALINSITQSRCLKTNCRPVRLCHRHSSLQQHRQDGEHRTFWFRPCRQNR